MSIHYLKYFVVGLILLGVQQVQGQQPNYVEGDVIIKFKDSSDIATRQSINGGSNTIVLQGVSGNVQLQLEKSFNNFSIQHYSSVEEQSTMEIIQQIQDHPSIEYVEPNYLIQKADIPDADIFTLSEVQALQGTQGENRDPIHAKDAQDILSQNNTPVNVAVLDTGIDVEHEALVNVIWTNTGEIPGNDYDDDGNGFKDDINGWNFADNDNDLTDCDGHGTHVSGIIAQTANDLFSENPDPHATSPIQIMGLKFLGCDGVGSTSNAIKAIDYAIDNGALILNNSWGNNVYSYALHEAIARSYYAKTVFVAAAGNNQANNDIEPFYPASYPVPNVISVAATDLNDEFAISISNYGHQSVHEAAPGVRILSTYPDNQYALLSGTSMAAPFVAGVAALMMYEQPGMPGFQVKNLLLDSSEQLPGLSDYVEGQRRLNALQAITLAQQTPPDYNVPNYQMPRAPSSSSFASQLGGGCGLVSKMYSDMSKIGSGKKSGNHLPKALFGLMLAIPLMLWSYLKQQALQTSKRAHERYQVDVSAQLSVDNHFASAHLFSISQGGAGLSVGKSTHLKKGDQIDIHLSSTHNEMVTFSGRVVWMSAEGKVGVQFKEDVSWMTDLFLAWNLETAKERC